MPSVQKYMSEPSLQGTQFVRQGVEDKATPLAVKNAGDRIAAGIKSYYESDLRSDIQAEYDNFYDSKVSGQAYGQMIGESQDQIAQMQQAQTTLRGTEFDFEGGDEAAQMADTKLGHHIAQHKLQITKWQDAAAQGAMSTTELETRVEALTRRSIDNMPGLSSEFISIYNERKGLNSGEFGTFVTSEKAQIALEKDIRNDARDAGLDSQGPIDIVLANLQRRNAYLAEVKIAKDQAVLINEQWKLGKLDAHNTLAELAPGIVLDFNSEINKLMAKHGDINEGNFNEFLGDLNTMKGLYMGQLASGYSHGVGTDAYKQIEKHIDNTTKMIKEDQIMGKALKDYLSTHNQIMISRQYNHILMDEEKGAKFAGLIAILQGAGLGAGSLFMGKHGAKAAAEVVPLWQMLDGKKPKPPISSKRLKLQETAAIKNPNNPGIRIEPEYWVNRYKVEGQSWGAEEYLAAINALGNQKVFDAVKSDINLEGAFELAGGFLSEGGIWEQSFKEDYDPAKHQYQISGGKLQFNDPVLNRTIGATFNKAVDIMTEFQPGAATMVVEGIMNRILGVKEPEKKDVKEEPKTSENIIEVTMEELLA